MFSYIGFPIIPIFPITSLGKRIEQLSPQSPNPTLSVSSSSSGSGIYSGGSSTHNKYSAHIPQSISKLPDFVRHPCHRLSKSFTSCSVAVAGSASFDIHVKPKVRRHRQHRSRLSKVFPLNAWALSCRRSRATYPFATNLSTSTFSFSFEQLTTSSTSLIIILQACPPHLPNRTALDSISHFCKKLPGIQTSFDVTTETQSSSGSFPLIQKAIVLGVPSSFDVDLNRSYSFFNWARISS